MIAREDRALLGITGGILVFLVLFLAGVSSAETARPVVYVIPVEGVIDLGLAPLSNEC